MVHVTEKISLIYLDFDADFTSKFDYVIPRIYALRFYLQVTTSWLDKAKKWRTFLGRNRRTGWLNEQRRIGQNYGRFGNRERSTDFSHSSWYTCLVQYNTEQRILLNCARKLDLNSASHAMRKDGFLFAFRDDLRFLSYFFIWDDKWSVIWISISRGFLEITLKLGKNRRVSEIPIVKRLAASIA